MKAFFVTLLLFIQLVLVFSACPKIIKKHSWGGKSATNVEYIVTPVLNIIIHHTATPTCTDESDCAQKLVNMQHYHMNQQNFDDIGYNFIIGGDGQVYEGVGWHKVGAHVRGWNRKSLGIAFMGDYSSKKPSWRQLNVAKDLIQCGVDLGEIHERYKLFGARSVRSTDSPGNALFEVIQSWKGFTRSP